MFCFDHRAPGLATDKPQCMEIDVTGHTQITAAIQALIRHTSPCAAAAHIALCSSGTCRSVQQRHTSRDAAAAAQRLPHAYISLG